MIPTRALHPDGVSPPLDGHAVPPIASVHAPEFTCPDCRHTLVPTDECVPDLRLEHRCQALPPTAAASG